MPSPILKTERLILRNLEKSDAASLAYLLKPEIENFAGPYMPHSESDLLQHVERIAGDTSWGITLTDGTFIGDIGVFSVAENKIGEIAWYMDPRFWKRGYGFEAGRAVLDYVFDTLGLCRISAQIASENTGSRKLAEKLGFHLDAILPDANLGGKVTDIAYYSVKNPCAKTETALL